MAGRAAGSRATCPCSALRRPAAAAGRRGRAPYSAERSERAGRSRVQAAVPDDHGATGSEMRGQPFHEIHGAVLAAGASDRHGEVAAVVARVRGQPGLDEVAYVGGKLVDLRLALEEGGNVGMLPGEGAQPRIVEGVGQAARVE